MLAVTSGLAGMEYKVAIRFEGVRIERVDGERLERPEGRDFSLSWPLGRPRPKTPMAQRRQLEPGFWRRATQRLPSGSTHTEL